MLAWKEVQLHSRDHRLNRLGDQATKMDKNRTKLQASLEERIYFTICKAICSIHLWWKKKSRGKYIPLFLSRKQYRNQPKKKGPGWMIFLSHPIPVWEFLSKEEWDKYIIITDELEKISDLPKCFHRETQYFILCREYIYFFQISVHITVTFSGYDIYALIYSCLSMLECWILFFFFFFSWYIAYAYVTLLTFCPV